MTLVFKDSVRTAH